MNTSGDSTQTPLRLPNKHSKITITIDGPAGTGKSSVARQLAKLLGLTFLDTGAMYRAAAVIGLDADIDLNDGVAIADAVLRSGMTFDWETDPPHLWIHWPREYDVSSRIRDAEITKAVSVVAGLPEVRSLLVRLQRHIRDTHTGLVTEGRDQGSIVFPDADVIFYLDATPEVRAARRAKQLRQIGKVTDVDEAQIRQDIIRRDEIDRSRKDGPLVKPENAIVVDTTNLTEIQVIEHLVCVVRASVDPIRLTEGQAEDNQ